MRLKNSQKKRHPIEHTWNMVNSVTHDHMVFITVYAAERQNLRSSWSRREASDAINSASRVDDDLTKYVQDENKPFKDVQIEIEKGEEDQKKKR